MKFSFWRCIAIIISIFVGCGNSAFGETSPAQRTLKTYALHNDPHSGDISPDEQLVVTESTLQTEAREPGTKIFAEIVEVWNFKEGKLLAEARLQQADVKEARQGSFPDPILGQRIVRFSSDGNTVIVLVGKTIHILHASDLSNIRTIALAAPSNVVRTYRGKAVADEPRIAAMEPSPQGNNVAVLWTRDLLAGRIDLYDLSNGNHIQSWNTPQGWVYMTKNLSWTADGKSLFVGIPNESPCASPGGSPDVFGFDPYTGAIQHRLTTGLLVGDVAVTAGDHLLAVDSDCLGVFKNHDPKLRVLDILTGKRVRELSGRGAGVRYTVSVSADGTRCLAFTGRMRAKFDWGDMVPFDKVADETFSVWDLKHYQGLLTSQNIPGLRASGLRISAKGGYAVSFGKASFIYQLP